MAIHSPRADLADGLDRPRLRQSGSGLQPRPEKPSPGTSGTRIREP